MEAAHRLNVSLQILDAPESPARQLSSSSTAHVNGHYSVAQDIKTLAAQSSLLTVEIEHIDCDALEAAHKEFGLPIHPAPSTLRLIQDKLNQKVFLSERGIPVAAFRSLSTESVQRDMPLAIQAFGLPLMVKARTAAYDGRGNTVLTSGSSEDIQSCIEALGGGPQKGGPELYIEKWAPFSKELAVMVARDIHGNVVSYPCVETVQKDSICHLVIAPAQIDGLIAKRAQETAEKAVACLDGAGIFGVELFLMADGESLFFISPFDLYKVPSHPLPKDRFY